MTVDNFSQKEILIQLMTKVDIMTTAMNEQKVLLTGITERSESRDLKLSELKTELEIVKKDLEELKTFYTRIMTMWAAFMLLLSLFGKEIVNRIF